MISFTFQYAKWASSTLTKSGISDYLIVLVKTSNKQCKHEIICWGDDTGDDTGHFDVLQMYNEPYIKFGQLFVQISNTFFHVM